MLATEVLVVERTKKLSKTIFGKSGALVVFRWLKLNELEIQPKLI